MAEPSLALVFQGTANVEAARKWFNRLVWAQLPVGNAKLWWPALRFENVDEFDRENEHDAGGNLEYRIDLTLCIMEKIHSGDGPVQVVRYLGRPLSDVQSVHQKDVLDFLGHMSTIPGPFSPEHFVAQLGLDRARPFYEDFHRGMDDFAKIIYQCRPRPPNFEPWAIKAQRHWEQYLANHHSQPMVLHQDPPPVAHLPPQPPSLRHALSPNHSVAAVSVAEESVASVHAPHRANATHSTAKKASSGQDADKTPQHLDYDMLPRLDPLGMITWKEARVQITCAGWTKVKNSAVEQYQPYPKGPHLSLEQTKNVCQRIYGWKPLAEEATHTPLPPPRMPTRHHDPPESNAKNYSFGFLWKHKCVPDGWKRVKPPREAAALVDYYYLRPDTTLQNLGVKNQDYFEDHYAVLDWCQRNNYYPSSEWNTPGDDTSVATEVADDPSVYLDEVEPSKGLDAKLKKTKKKKKRKSPRNYSFGVLWASHLEPNGWTMPKAKRQALVDYYYVRPGCTVEGGKLNVDYFATTDAVLEYCARHQDYPESSGASTCSPDDKTIGTATLANEETTDDESTKIPAETEDEAIKQNMEDDDHTLGEFSTPGTKTQPQDPGKPLLRDDEDTSEPDEEEIYYWKNLWPVLEKQRGWECIKAKNKFEDWWYVLPRKLRLEGGNDEMAKGVDYFTTEQEVIDYCKRVDREDNLIRLKTTTNKGGDSKPKPSDNSHQKSKASPDPKTIRPKKNPPKPKIKRDRVQGPKTASDICVIVDNDKNVDAPWVHSPLPRNLHSIVTTVGGIHYAGSYYYLHNESHKNFTHRFQDIPELLKHLCSMGRGNYFLNREAKLELINEYTRLIDYAFVPGSIFDHRRIRPLNKDEIILCLKEIFNFTFTDGEWQVPNFLRTKPEAELEGTPSQLKPSYQSLPELLQALRGIEHLEGDSGGRRRKPLDKKSVTEQRDHLIMAFRLSIAEDMVVNALENDVESDASEVKPNEKKKSPKTTNGGDKTDGYETTSSTGKNKKRASPGSASKKGSKKLKPDGKFEIEDLKVKWMGDPQKNPAPWMSMTCRDFSSAKLIGVSHNGGNYYLPNESNVNFTARFTSIDEVFTHLCTYGNYSLLDLDKDLRLELKKHIALGNVPGLASSWNKYRLLDSGDAIAILGLLGFKEQPDKSWVVPEVLLQEKNPFRKGNPPLIKTHYPSLDELRVALRSLPDLEVADGGRRRRREGKLNEHQTIAFRLWLASGPEGPDDTRVDDNTDDQSTTSAKDEAEPSPMIDDATNHKNSHQVDSVDGQHPPENDQLECGDLPQETVQSPQRIEMHVLDDSDTPGAERNATDVAPVMESKDAPCIHDSNEAPCAGNFNNNHTLTTDSLIGAHEYTLITPTEPQGGFNDLEMADSETEPTNESMCRLSTPSKPQHTSAGGDLQSTCSDTEMTDADFAYVDRAIENICPNILDVCMGNTGRGLLTQPRGNMSQEIDDEDDDYATFFNFGHRVPTSPTSPAETKAMPAEDLRKVYSVEQGGTRDWMTQPMDD